MSDETDWKCLLSADEYHVTREGGTERAFTGRYWNEKRKGTYNCICCKTPLFTSETKYDSGSGWPSFFQPVAVDSIKKIEDVSHGMVRTEIRCATCDAHLGHVFPDGPPPTHIRYCVNSLSLDFIPE